MDEQNNENKQDSPIVSPSSHLNENKNLNNLNMHTPNINVGRNNNIGVNPSLNRNLNNPSLNKLGKNNNPFPNQMNPQINNEENPNEEENQTNIKLPGGNSVTASPEKEGVKEVAKQAAGSYLAAHGVPKGIADETASKVVNKISENPHVDKQLEKVVKNVKEAKVKIIVAALFALLPLIVTGIAISILVLGPVVRVIEFAEMAQTGVSNFFESAGNLFTRGCAHTTAVCNEKSETEFYQKIDDVYETYNQKYQVKIETGLLGATLLYDQIDYDKRFEELSEITTEDVEDSSINYDKLKKKITDVAKKQINKHVEIFCDGTLVKTHDRIDIDEEPEKSYTCPPLQSKSYNITYTLDKDKYRDYLTYDYVPKLLFNKDISDFTDGQFIVKVDLTDDEKLKVSTVVNEIFEFSETAYLLAKQQQSNPNFTSAYGQYCSNITVEGTGTMTLEEYVAGVVTAEFGGASLEARKAQAIAARTYVLSHTKSNCTIQNSSARQNYKTPTQNGIEAAEATKGLVLLNSNGKIFSTEYDAFCYSSKDSNNYYFEYQKLPGTSKTNFTLPVSWVNSKSIVEEWKNCPCNQSKTNTDPACFNSSGTYLDGGHGRGMSQWAAQYYAEQGMTYDQILTFFYDNVTIGNLPSYNLNGNGTNLLLGSSLLDTVGQDGINNINNAISSAVASAPSVREGVVAAAKTLINQLNTYNIRIPYYWGGGHGVISNGINPSWGSQTTPATSIYGETYRYLGLDCSGFVSWAIKNGGCTNTVAKTASLWDTVGNHISYSDVKPGDLLANEGHVLLVVDIDGDKIVSAESTGGSYGVIFKTYDKNSSSAYDVVDMTSYYNSSSCK